MTTRNLDALFEPKSIALIGASNQPRSVGAVTAKNLFEGWVRRPDHDGQSSRASDPVNHQLPFCRRAAPGARPCGHCHAPADRSGDRCLAWRPRHSRRHRRHRRLRRRGQRRRRRASSKDARGRETSPRAHSWPELSRVHFARKRHQRELRPPHAAKRRACIHQPIRGACDRRHRLGDCAGFRLLARDFDRRHD